MTTGLSGENWAETCIRDSASEAPKLAKLRKNRVGATRNPPYCARMKRTGFGQSRIDGCEAVVMFLLSANALAAVVYSVVSSIVILFYGL